MDIPDRADGRQLLKQYFDPSGVKDLTAEEGVDFILRGLSSYLEVAGESDATSLGRRFEDLVFPGEEVQLQRPGLQIDPDTFMVTPIHAQTPELTILVAIGECRLLIEKVQWSRMMFPSPRDGKAMKSIVAYKLCDLPREELLALVTDYPSLPRSVVTNLLARLNAERVRVQQRMGAVDVGCRDLRDMLDLVTRYKRG